MQHYKAYMGGKHIIWDWNGTLLNDVQAGLNAVNLMLAVRNLPTLSLTQYRDVFCFPVRNFYHTVGFRLTDEEWDTLADEFHRNFLSDTTIALHENAGELLSLLSQAGFCHYLLSASKQSILDKMLAEYQLAAFFQQVCGTDNLDGYSKLEVGTKLKAGIGSGYEQLLLIGDSLHDYEVAITLGIDCLLVAQGHQSYQRLQSAGVPLFHNLFELSEWLLADQYNPVRVKQLY